nr:immunoglobulin light chain junction region [Macaca mulatta]
CMQGTHFPLTF